MYENSPSKNNNKEDQLKGLLKTFSLDPILEKVFAIHRFRLDGKNVVPPKRICKILSFLVSTTITVTYFVCRVFPVGIHGIPFEFNAFKELPNFFIFAQYWITCLSTTSLRNDINIKVITDIHRLDTGLRLNLSDDFYSSARRRGVVMFVVLVVAHIVFVLCDDFSDGVFTVSGQILALVYFCQDLELYIFCKFITMLNARLKVLNDYVKIVKKKNKIDSITPKMPFGYRSHSRDPRRRYPATSLYDLASLYDTIGETCSTLNDLFNFQIFTQLVSSFTYIIVTIWFTLDYFQGIEKENNLLRTATWCTRGVCVLSVLCYYCEKLLSTRNNTKMLVNEIIMDYSQPPTVRLQAKAFMELIEAWPLSVCVYDMFYVDVTLVLKFVSVATTYLIVIVQIRHLL